MRENFKLRVFRVVTDTLNFRRAADELHRTQPAVTAQIKTLEESLGIALFDRIGRDINGTPGGPNTAPIREAELSGFRWRKIACMRR